MGKIFHTSECIPTFYLIFGLCLLPMRKWLWLVTSLFIISLVVMIYFSFDFSRKLNNYYSSTDNVENSYTFLARIDRLEVIIKDLDRLERGFLLTRDSQNIKLLFLNINRLQNITDNELNKTLEESNELSQQKQYQNIVFLRSWIVSRLENLRNNLNVTQDSSGTLLSQKYFEAGKVSGQKCLEYIAKMKGTEYAALEQKNEHKKENAAKTFSLQRNLMVGFGALSIILFLFMIRELKSRISYQQQLLRKVDDLNRSTTELEQIAYASSHDLQEPVRKMQIFINRLLWKRKEFDEDTIRTLETVSKSAGRLQNLMANLADLTSLVNANTDAEEVNLKHVFMEVLGEFKGKAEEQSVEFKVDDLPVIVGYPTQIKLLFRALIDNAIKFCGKENERNVSLKCEKVKGIELVEHNALLKENNFFKITMTDNGIGFENKFAEKVFILFQRLHNKDSEYEGSGIGLAIAKRVMANHKGFIFVDSHPGEGASFKLFFPESSLDEMNRYRQL